VLGEAEPPGGQPDEPGSVITGGSSGAPRPNMALALLEADKLVGASDVILTNIILTVAVLITILITATIVNQVVQENEDEIEGFAGRFLHPFRAIGDAASSGWSLLQTNTPLAGTVLAPLVILSLAGVIYGFAEPGFGFNDKSLVLFSSIFLGLGLVTYTYSGGQALLTRRGFGVPAAVKLFPAGIAVAIGFVLLSRVESIQPGIIYGFIASFGVLGGASLTRHQEGQTIFFPGVALLALCIGAWLLLGPFRDLAEENDGWLAAVPEATVAAVFVGGLEGFFFNMIPLRFMDGAKLWNWNKLLWLVMTGGVTFLFWHVLINKEDSYFSALQKTEVATGVVILGICIALSAGLWLFFYLRSRNAGEQLQA
jgi:hypothetical protein